MATDKTARRILTKLERVPEIIARHLQMLVPSEGDPKRLKAWWAAYNALQSIDAEIGRLIDEAYRELQAEGEVRQADADNTGSNSAVGK